MCLLGHPDALGLWLQMALAFSHQWGMANGCILLPKVTALARSPLCSPMLPSALGWAVPCPASIIPLGLLGLHKVHSPPLSCPLGDELLVHHQNPHIILL